ncbi:alpha-ketoacid dehydrogenase subunit beta [Streptantibioticus cattleyicolor]|uniref:Pyruvate dehydrogenase E1 component subunit beta n=1 Tax=Streptantibioticus cattleyicolor (strain ATCC 35852 / DSM 46488 / JCM 4925 / NBRC 14057 / NRRL 8057) TaxID=1003195 RepID=F8JKR5_STREN|nr:transketolase C-terminal domain-containing protein [Streptantibioticus cattleyicolor]AEW98442.1 Pyruvate dehydrogenase (acetyl-transferring) [Streptantibioticus cattleyicolor NRRL 8057 = DSM 46488]CCB72503.1 Pyruvate/2-oxoglutarate dehydrogenase complex, dehydrogenase component beta subunit [Streptantibioticus cattleyicolor NRRL 8057 = DSM 46488]
MRVADNLNHALRSFLADDPAAYLLGEDVIDPYGGAFKVTRGLSTAFPDRVLTTPLSEGGIVGVGAGLALTGSPAVVEIMFADFVALAFDQLVNFASKSLTMYGRRLPMPLVVRCPSGGRRGYGPTHSQSPQKHFIGVPGLSVYEVSPFHDNGALLTSIVERAEPALLFEDKVLYTRPMFENGTVDDLFSYDFPADGVARVHVVDDPDACDCVLIAPGGVTDRALQAARRLLLEHEISVQILVPARLYPFDLEPLLPLLRGAGSVFVAEESTAGGTWGHQVAQQVHQALWGRLRHPVTLIHSADSIIPTAGHLEEQVLLQAGTICETVVETLRG